MTPSNPPLPADVTAMEDIIVQISWLSRRRMEHELAEFNLTVPQYMALRCIQQYDSGCSMSELAESSQQVSATMTGIVDRLVDSGLVQRERFPLDRRTLRVALTPAGRQLLEQVNEQKRAWIVSFLATLSPQERQSMIALAQRYLESIQQTVAVVQR